MPPRDRTRRRVTPRQDRARASVDAILVAAEQVLAEVGFARATTGRIAARAGVNVALVYRYFAGKEAIVGALVERGAERTLRAVQDALVEHASAPLAEAVRALVRALVLTPGLPQALHRELVEHVDVTRRRPAIHALRARASALFGEFLARRAGELRPHADSEALRFVLDHAVEGAAHAAAFYRPEGLDVARAVDALAELVLRVLVTEPASGG
ncbi:transcriptional regulator, TetR family [Nannocystis exedens]|uniref:Transcriptional regulator, TetR family n=1 Tax=Nannocystis exedens TaxID=54 RepID=A0A1I2E1A9_9BACT|nr:TetR/AcrR family transcriptional regulator [Nannocystis exedens]PCC69222.1 TetR family transcriptional regulator [Nannocystis exedens]SFE86712.1 transcriptional regulator, TetR family [Nannocystis exedens]